jgi:LysM repeat protein
MCGVVLSAAGLLSACTEQTPSPDATRAVQPISPATRRASPTPTQEATTNSTYLRDPEAAPWGVTLVPDETLVGHYTNYVYPVQVPRDGGPITYAKGTPITKGSKIVAYKVASGDIYDYIAKRFHLTNDGYLLILNEIRRGEAAQLYEGDVLNLSAYTLDKYGTVNGRVVKGPQPLTAPPQMP